MAYSTRSRNVTPYRATRHDNNPDVVDLLVLILTPTISLRGAACAGMAESFVLMRARIAVALWSFPARSAHGLNDMNPVPV